LRYLKVKLWTFFETPCSEYVVYEMVGTVGTLVSDQLEQKLADSTQECLRIKVRSHIIISSFSH